MNKIVPLIDVTNTPESVYQLIEDGDNTRIVSSIVNGSHKEIEDGPYTVFRVKGTGQQLIYSNFTNGIYDTNLNSLSDITPEDNVWAETQTHVKKKTKSNTPVWLRILF